MSIRHRFIVLLTPVILCLAAANAQAGLGDWLFGRTTTPYAAGYAPAVTTTGTPIVPSSGYAGTYQVQRFDNPSVYTNQPVVLAARPLQTGPLQTAYQLPSGGSAAPFSQRPTLPDASTAFRPSLGASLPQPTLAPPNAQIAPTITPAFPQASFAQPAAPLGTGLPFAARNTGGEVPLARVLRGNTTSNPFYGTGNLYPNDLPGQYSAAYGGRLGQLPVTAPPGVAVGSNSALFPNSPRPQVGGLARFFGSILGTNYRSSYYRAPITYYRPVTAVDPATGQPTVVQQACSSYEQQLRRVPFNQFNLGNGSTVTPIGQPTLVSPGLGGGCQNGSCGLAAAPGTFAQPFANQQFPNQAFPNQPFPVGPLVPATGAVGQVGGTTSPSDRDVIRIPSLDSQGSGTRSQGSGTRSQGSGTRSEFGDNRVPLTGSPSDRDNVEQPRLESARPRTDDYYRGYADGLYRGDVKSNRYERDLPSREGEYTQPQYTQPRETTPPLPTESPTDTRATESRQAESRYVEPKFRYDENSYETIEDANNNVEQSSYWPRETTPRTDLRSNLPELNAPLTSNRYSPHQTQTTPRLPSPFRVRPNTPVTLEDTAPSAGMTRELDDNTYSTLRPIQAPADLREPFPNHSLVDQTPDRDGWQARTSSSASTRITVPVRGATAGPREILGTATKKPAPRNQQRFTRQPTPAKKSVTYDSDGWLPL